MKKSFDNQLSEKIKEAFGTHQEPFNEAHWKDMKARLVNDKKTVPLVWLPHLAKAATVILLVGLMSYWVFLRENSITKIAMISVENQNKTYEIREPYFVEKQVDKETDLIMQNTENKYSSGIIANSSMPTTKVIEDTEAAFPTTAMDTEIVNEQFDFQMIEATSLSQNRPVVQIILAKKEITPATIEGIALFEDSHGSKSMKLEDRFGLGASFSTLYTYTYGASESQMNLAGGVTSEFALSPRLNMVSGVIIAKHDINTGNGQVYSGVISNQDTYENSVLAENIDDVETRLVALDFPLNLQYTFKSRRRLNYFVSGGVSSLLYLQEKYTFKTSNNTMQSANNDENKVFDFAKLVNFSFGIKYPVNHRQLLLIEPYIKLPVAKLTSSDIYLGQSGLTLRYIFH